jgi:hypothetical protein
MSAFDEFDSLVLSLDPVLYLPLMLGNLDKRDSYGGTATLLNTPGWVKTGKGHAVTPNVTGAVLVADSGAQTELQISDATILMLSPGFVANTAQYLIAKLDAGGWAYGFRTLVGPERLFTYDGAVSSSLTTAYHNARSLGVRIVSGDPSEFFVNGKHVGVGSLTCTPVANDADISIGNIYTGTAPMNSPIGGALIFPTAMADQNIADICTLYSRVTIPTHRSKLSPPGLFQVKDQLLRLDGTVSGGKVLDFSGNGLNMTPAPEVMMEEVVPSGGRGMKAWGAAASGANVSITDARLDNFGNPAKTIAFWLRRDGNGEANAGRIFEKAASKLLLSISFNGNLTLLEGWSGGNATWTSAGVLDTGVWIHMVIRMDGLEGSVPSIFVNGVAISVSTVVASSGSKSDDTGEFTLLNNPNNIREWDGAIDDFQIVERYLTDAEAQGLYFRSALRCERIAHRTEHPISGGNVTSGFIGPWEWVAGTFQWVDDGTKRALLGIASSTALHPSKQAYGGWYCRMEKPNTGRTRFAFMLSSRALLDGASQNGYELEIDTDESIRLRTIRNGGIVANVIITAAGYVDADTEYELYVARRTRDSLFSAYIRGGGFTTWTLIGTGIDTEHTVSTHIAMSSVTSNSRLSDVIFFPYGGGIDPTAGDLDSIL